jgi:membrane protein implicated in regulation of membrane protease activity
MSMALEEFVALMHRVADRPVPADPGRRAGISRRIARIRRRRLALLSIGILVAIAGLIPVLAMTGPGFKTDSLGVVTAPDWSVAVFWIVLAVVLATAEIFTGTFMLLMLGAGALAAAAVAGVGGPVALQGLVFAGASAASILGIRPFLQRALTRNSDQTPMGLEAIEGSAGLVMERVDLDHGLIKIDGEMWTARPYDATQTFDEGERVRVIEIRGATALVWKE